MTTSDVTLDQVLALARRLRPDDQSQLIARLAPHTQHLLETTESTTALEQPPLRGLLADLGLPQPTLILPKYSKRCGRLSRKICVVQAMRQIDRSQVPDLPDRIVAATG